MEETGPLSTRVEESRVTVEPVKNVDKSNTPNAKDTTSPSPGIESSR